MISTILTFLKEKVVRKFNLSVFLGVLTALSIVCGIILYNKNKKLSERLEIADLNIEAYLDIVTKSLLANSVLLLDFEQLKDSHDDLLLKLDSVRQKNNIKAKNIATAATQTQFIDVSSSKGVRGKDIVQVIYKDSIYTDTIQFNPLTKVTYSIGTDSVCVSLDIKNTQYLYVYSSREYKNKKNFFKRLFTWDWKKVTRNKYIIENTNDLIKTDSVRVVESILK